MTQLHNATLAAIAASGQITAPTYDRAGLVPGIMHFGVGNFHRAHQAMVIDRLLEQGLARDFAICGVGVLPGDARMRDVLDAQDGLYLLELKHPDGAREARVIGSIVDYLFAPDDPAAVIDRLASPSTRIVSLTVTEGGYNYDQVTGEFDAANPDVQHDLAHPDTPCTTFGLIVAALRRRRDAGAVPFTVMSCDNIPGNGHVAKRMITAFAALQDPGFADWIAEHVAFPNSMVDRITPATTDEDRAHVRDELDVDDGWPVAAEPFFQWVLEDTFTDGRPPFEQAGVQLVNDVTPYELMKLRLLNVSHQAMAYFGYLAGYRYADEAMSDPDLSAMVRAYMDLEGAPTLPPVPGIDLDRYKDTLIERFSNPAIKDTLARLAAQSSDRIPKWLVPVIHENLAAGRGVEVSAGIVASWARYAEGVDEAGEPITLVDRLADDRHAAALRQRENPTAFLENASLFGDLATNSVFIAAYTAALASLHTQGAKVTYSHLADGADPRIVIFDLGEVLATPPGLYDAFATRIAHDPAVVEAAYWRHRDEYDRGGEGAVFWTAVLEDVGIPATAAAVEDLTRIDTDAWTTIRPDAAALLEQLHAAGIRVGILSNATIDMAGAARRTPWAAWVTDWFFSAEVGFAKPDPSIYRHVVDAVGIPAAAITFIDDRQVNVDAARAAGWNAHLWISGADTLALLRGRGFLRSNGQEPA